MTTVVPPRESSATTTAGLSDESAPSDDSLPAVPLASPSVSVVIPVYNSGRSIESVVHRVQAVFAQSRLQIVLVNDGSSDDSEVVCLRLAERCAGVVLFLNLSRNFGEHAAVLAGLNHVTGEVVCVLDDDGQNPPEELPRLIEHLLAHRYDVVYGRYTDRKHHWGRRLGSWFNNAAANLMLHKPRGLYLSSFKVMTRFVADEITRYRGPFPYIDGLICRTTSKLGQVAVRHDERLAGRSGYTLRRLVRLWLNMFLGFSIVPLRLSVLLGLLASSLSALGLIGIVIDKLWINPDVTVGVPTVLVCIVFFAGVQLIVLGTIGEYVGRIFLDASGTPQYIVRSKHGRSRSRE